MKKADAHNPWASPNVVPWDEDPPKFHVYEDMRVRDRQNWVDMCPDLIAFWRRGVEAAEKGEEVERMQEFLEKLEEEKEELEKSMGANPWDADPVHDWGWNGGADDWGAHSAGWGADAGAWETPMAWSSGKSEGLQHHGHQDVVETSAPSFVEEYAQRQSVGADRKEKMRRFYEVGDV